MEEYKDISRGLKMLLDKAEEMGWNWEAYIEPDNRRTYVEIGQSSPAGEDFSMVIDFDEENQADSFKDSLEEINRISDFVRCSDQIDELSFRQMVNDRYETEYYNDDFLKAGHNKGLWHYIRQKDYNIYYAENRIYTKFSEIEADIQEER